LSRKSIKDIRLLLNQLFKFAVEQDLVTKNPVASTKLPKESRVLTDHDDEVKAISPDDRATILAATEGNPVMKTALTTLMFTGMRIGEFLALTWENVDFEKGIISVNAALTHATEYYDRKLTRRSTVVGTTKTSSGVRNIKVSSVVTDALREWREYLPGHFRCAIEHDPLAPTAVVFPNDRGEMRTYNGFRTTYRRFMTEKQLPPYTLHSYRHTFATMLLEQGVNPRVVQKLLGHADIETTLGTYSHVFAEVYDGAADKLTAVFDGMMGA
jgi:integrase